MSDADDAGGRPAGPGFGAVPLPPGYTLVERLGAGGFATVWLAEQGRLGRRVAVKVLGETLDDAERERRFLAECRAIGRLSGHPSVVTVHDAGTTDSGHPYLVMEHLPGGSLHERLARGGALGWAETLDIGIHVADALAAAHDAGILHRDVKPANVLLDSNGEPKLGDFGIARLSEGVNTATGILVGTISYTPPEVLSGHRPDATADVWALGATIHALLSGTSAFSGDRDEPPAATIARVLRSEPPPLAPEIPSEVRAVVAEMLDADPARRPSTAAEVVARLQAIQQSHALAVTPAQATRANPLPAGAAGQDGSTGTAASDALPVFGADSPSAVDTPAPPPPPPLLAKAEGPGPQEASRTWEPPVPGPPPPRTGTIDGAAPTTALPGSGESAPAFSPIASRGPGVAEPDSTPGTQILGAGAPGDGGAPRHVPYDAGSPVPPPPPRSGDSSRSKLPLFAALGLVVVLMMGAAVFLVLNRDGGTSGGGGGSTSAGGSDPSTSDEPQPDDTGGETPVQPAVVSTNTGSPLSVAAGPAGDPQPAWGPEASCLTGDCMITGFDGAPIVLEGLGSGTGTLRRLDPADGSEAWSVPVGGLDKLVGLTRLGERIMVSSTIGAIRTYQTFDAATGAAGATLELAHDARPALPNPQPSESIAVITLIDAGEVVLFDLGTGEQTTIEGRLLASDAGTVFTAVEDQIAAYDLSSGQMRGAPIDVESSMPEAGEVPSNRHAVVSGTVLYATTEDDGVAVISTESLTVLRTEALQDDDGEDLGSPVAMALAGDVALAVAEDGVVAFDAATGDRRWSIDTDTSLVPDGPGSVWFANAERLFAGEVDGDSGEARLTLIALTDGSQVADLTFSGVSGSGAVVPMADGIAVAHEVDGSGLVTGVGFEQGQDLWSVGIDQVSGLAVTTSGVAAVTPDGLEGLVG